ncbi:5-oxoprolinase subunit PxpB [Wenyingzhuangia sp. 1_MG-2023]|nr:5-oxoprolinase subunit PxpB [Wenyingzhuangia sp. 1_MG-2023]
MQYEVLTYGESAFLIKFENEISVEIHLQVKSLYLQLKNIHLVGVISLIPAYNSLTVIFDDQLIDGTFLKLFLEKTKFKKEGGEMAEKTIEIPVCYEKPYALDLQEVSEKLNLTPSEIIALHTSKTYLVYMLGFAPGFMYLGGLDPRLFIPRKDTPRLKVAAGSVGLADQQTGVYPLETPGGWQIIGKTPIPLFSKKNSALVSMGDRVKFVSITAEEYLKMECTWQ